jgi:two-component system nitrogen regulation sensor histidine kinase GlnL
MLGPKGNDEQEPHNIHELIAYVLEVVNGEKPDNIAIKLDYDPSIPEISMDFGAMVQALLNLVKNGIQAMEDHGGLLTIRTRVESKFTLGTKTYPLVAVISVIDEGVGIDPEVFDAIFYPMVSSKKEGTGLGLPVSQNIVRQHGGLIVAQSEPGNTVFNIYLPFDHNREEAQKISHQEKL